MKKPAKPNKAIRNQPASFDRAADLMLEERGEDIRATILNKVTFRAFADRAGLDLMSATPLQISDLINTFKIEMFSKGRIDLAPPSSADPEQSSPDTVRLKADLAEAERLYRQMFTERAQARADAEKYAAIAAVYERALGIVEKAVGR